MKTVISFLLVFSGLVFFSSCGGDTEPKSKNNVDPLVLADDYCKCLSNGSPDSTCVLMGSRHYDLLLDDLDASKTYAQKVVECAKK